MRRWPSAASIALSALAAPAVVIVQSAPAVSWLALDPDPEQCDRVGCIGAVAFLEAPESGSTLMVRFVVARVPLEPLRDVEVALEDPTGRRWVLPCLAAAAADSELRPQRPAGRMFSAACALPHGVPRQGPLGLHLTTMRKALPRAVVVDP